MDTPTTLVVLQSVVLLYILGTGNRRRIYWILFWGVGAAFDFLELLKAISIHHIIMLVFSLVMLAFWLGKSDDDSRKRKKQWSRPTLRLLQLSQAIRQ